MTVDLFADVRVSFHPVLLPGDSGASGEPLSVVSASDDGARAGVQVTIFFGGATVFATFTVPGHAYDLTAEIETSAGIIREAHQTDPDQTPSTPPSSPSSSTAPSPQSSAVSPGAPLSPPSTAASHSSSSVTPAPPGASTGPVLPRTGVQFGPLFALALVSMGLGALLVWAARRGQRTWGWRRR